MVHVRGLIAVSVVAAMGGPTWADPKSTKLIDDQLAARLRAEKVAPVGRADDATLVRRMYLDLLGRPPSAAEAQSYFDDPAADKHHRLIGKLRSNPETAAHWRRVIAGWLRATEVRRARLSGNDLLEYLGGAVGQNRGWDRVARDLLDPDAQDKGSREAVAYLGYFLEGDDKKAGRDAVTVAVASAFFGAQLQCARCHDHPTVPAWTKAHYDGLRAFFDHTDVIAGRDSVETLVERTPGKGATRPMFLDGTTFDLGNRPRAKLSRHAVRADATHFKRAVVNRVWKELLGRGLVEPVDMMHDGNPGSHPQLLAALADDFAENGFNFDRLIASIMHSEVYQRSARWTGPVDQRPPAELFAVAELRPLTGHQMAWAVALAAGYTPEVVAHARRNGLARGGAGVPWLEARFLWEKSRDYATLVDTFRSGGPASTPRHALYLTFDPFVTSLLDPRWGVVKEMADESDDDVAISLAYLAILNRRPTRDEMQVVKEHIQTAKDRKTACQDLAWALIASAEFRFNH